MRSNNGTPLLYMTLGYIMDICRLICCELQTHLWVLTQLIPVFLYWFVVEFKKDACKLLCLQWGLKRFIKRNNICINRKCASFHTRAFTSPGSSHRFILRYRICRLNTKLYYYSSFQTSNSMQMVMYYIARHSEIQEKIRAEIHDVIGKDPTQPISQADLNNLKYLRAAVREVQR